MVKIRKAIIPTAGLGKRMFPLTKQVPKEMLFIKGKPMIQWGIEDLLNSKIEEICIVISPQKKIIKNYLLKKRIRKLNFVYQEIPQGVCQAILLAKKFIDNEPFVLMFLDQLLFSKIPATKQLIANHNKTKIPAIWTSLVKVPQNEICYFTGSGFAYQEKRGRLQDIKMLSEQETFAKYKNLNYQIRGFGRTILYPSIFEFLRKAPFNKKTKEFDYGQAFKDCTKNFPHYGILLRGRPCDFGTLAGYKYYTDKLWKRRKES